jgi:hypothetical protein
MTADFDNSTASGFEAAEKNGRTYEVSAVRLDVEVTRRKTHTLIAGSGVLLIRLGAFGDE